MRKIALFSTTFLPYSQTFVYDEIRAHSENYEITVFCKDRQNEAQFPYDNFHKPEGVFAESFYQHVAYWPGFNKVFSKVNFDLIHSHFGNGAVYALPYVKRFNLPFVVSFHGNDVAALMGIQKIKPARWRYFLKHKAIFNRAALLLAASEELRALLIELGASPKKVRVHRLGVDLTKFEYREPVIRNTVKFLMIGRLTPKKGHLYALKALRSIVRKGADVSLNLIGSGALLDTLKQFVNENGLQKFVSFDGVLTPEEISSVLRSSDVLLAPSIISFDQDRDSGLMVVKEAASVGVPAIGTWHGGIHEIIDDNKTGFLVPERNVPLLADKMMRFVDNSELIRSFGRAARKKMEREYDLFDQVKKLEELYEEAISIHECNK